MWKLELNLKRIAIMLVAALAVIGLVIATKPPPVMRVVHKLEGKNTLDDKLAQYGAAARKRLEPAFTRKGIHYPPKNLIFVGLKQERALQIYAANEEDDYCFVKSYPILGASGKLGPKLAEGDFQVPEGIYKVVFLNPNSLYHLSLRLNYPNEFDQSMAEKEGRTKLGRDIMIHGDQCSVGCLAMGDPASEDLFILAADTGIENIKVILSPVDFRKSKLRVEDMDVPGWTKQVYEKVTGELQRLPLPEQ